jgi:outer membrane protein OmpA-like peptidoglycan-associated protein
MNKQIYILLLFLLHQLSVLSQKGLVTASIADCEGAINIFESGNFSVEFLGNSGRQNDIQAYPSLSNVSEKNSIWCVFIAPSNGVVTLDAYIPKGYLQLVVFLQERKDICEEIHKGSAEIKRLFSDTDSNYVEISKRETKRSLYSLDLKKGQKIALLFNTNLKLKETLRLNFNFSSLDIQEEQDKGETKIVDFRDDEFSTALNFKVRDAVTGLPLVANLIISRCNDLDALYLGSDFYFQVLKPCKMVIKCDAKGYFFNDKIESIMANTNAEITILLEPIKKGKSFTIEQIEFIPGSSDFLPSSTPRLNRLKDFLALNSEVQIEIQGHVFSMEENSLAGQKISEARAKRVFNYLVTNGINKDRMITKGYGNTRPIFPNPRFSYEEQMNRRVEIKVL